VAERQAVSESVQAECTPAYHESIANSKLSSLAPHLHVVWLAADEVSQYGLAAMLDLVAQVADYEVCMDRHTVEQRLHSDPIDVCVLPASSSTPDLAGLVSRCGAKLVLTFPGAERPRGSIVGGRDVDYWIQEQRLSLNTLQTVFQELSMPTTQDAEVVTSNGSAVRVLQKVTERERSVLQLVAHGQSNRQIASSLNLSIHGVKRHVSNLLLKFDCANRTELALAASQLQIDLTRPAETRSMAAHRRSSAHNDRWRVFSQRGPGGPKVASTPRQGEPSERS